jgi:radical SAM superfamily enzyme YgiQ (UPF0313 family)
MLNVQFPLGLGYIAGMLRHHGIDVRIVDLSAERSKAKFNKLLADYSPHIVGISCMTQNHRQAIQLAQAVKTRLKETTLILGGVHSTFMYADMLERCPALDLAVIGEGEYAMLELCDRYQGPGSFADLASIRGIAHRVNGTVKLTSPRERNTALDELPFPAFDLVALPSLEAYFTKAKALPILTSRGCPFQCAFCSTSVMHGRQYRARAPEAIVDEIERDAREFGINCIYFVDDTFTLDKKRATNICLEMIRRGVGVNWGCSARVDTVSPELLHLMKKAGCETIFCGIESLDDSVLTRIRKGFTAADAQKAVSWIMEAGMVVDTSFIIGLPGESLAGIRKVGRFTRKNKIKGRVLTNTLQILPGTEMCNHSEEFGIHLPSGYQSNWFQPRSFTSALSDKDLLKEKIRIQVAAFEARESDKRLYEIPMPDVDIDLEGYPVGS